MFVLLPVAKARQSPGAAAAQALSVATSAENPPEGQREKADPGTEKAAAPFPKFLFCCGEKR